MFLSTARAQINRGKKIKQQRILLFRFFSKMRLILLKIEDLVRGSTSAIEH